MAEAWIDRHGDVWMQGADGQMYTPDTAPFPREYVERKWGPLRLINLNPWKVPAERGLLSALCDGDMVRPGQDGYCFKHYAPVKWAGHANVSDVCCIDVEDYVEQVLALRQTAPTPADVPGQGEVALTRALISDPVIGPELTTWIAEGVARRVLASSWLAERDAEVARRAVDERESYTIAQIRAAFAKHAHPDDWNVRAFYERGLIAALRGEYDTEDRP